MLKRRDIFFFLFSSGGGGGGGVYDERNVRLGVDERIEMRERIVEQKISARGVTRGGGGGGGGKEDRPCLC